MSDTPYTHSDACVASADALQRFLDRWPRGCVTCGARGFWETGGSYVDPPDGGLCPDCLEDGRCPRCGDDIIDLDDPPACGICGWDIEVVAADDRAAEAAGMVMPWHECQCGQAERDAAMEADYWNL